MIISDMESAYRFTLNDHDVLSHHCNNFFIRKIAFIHNRMLDMEKSIFEKKTKSQMFLRRIKQFQLKHFHLVFLAD